MMWNKLFAFPLFFNPNYQTVSMYWILVFVFSSIISKSIIVLTTGNIFSLTGAFFSCSHPPSKPRVDIIHDYGNLKLHMWPLSAAHCIWTWGLASGCVSTGTGSPLSADSAVAGSSVARCLTKGLASPKGRMLPLKTAVLGGFQHCS